MQSSQRTCWPHKSCNGVSHCKLFILPAMFLLAPESKRPFRLVSQHHRDLWIQLGRVRTELQTWTAPKNSPFSTNLRVDPPKIISHVAESPKSWCHNHLCWFPSRFLHTSSVEQTSHQDPTFPLLGSTTNIISGGVLSPKQASYNIVKVVLRSRTLIT